MNYVKPSFINSDGKSNNINQEVKLRSTKPNFNGSNKIVIIANNNKSSSNDNKSNKNSNNNNLNTSINNNK